MNEPKFGEWQPIETAPKDGSDILLGGCQHGPAIRVASWGNGRYLGPKKGYERDWCDGPQYGFAPTHWMPLPAPPLLASAPPLDGEDAK